MKCDCCMKNFKSDDLVNFGELIVCKSCSKKNQKMLYLWAILFWF